MNKKIIISISYISLLIIFLFSSIACYNKIIDNLGKKGRDHEDRYIEIQVKYNGHEDDLKYLNDFKYNFLGGIIENDCPLNSLGLNSHNNPWSIKTEKFGSYIYGYNKIYADQKYFWSILNSTFGIDDIVLNKDKYVIEYTKM